MIIRVKNNKIEHVLLGDVSPKQGDICVPSDFSLTDAINFIENGISFTGIFSIDEKNPDNPFELQCI